jgi:regulatory protein
MPDGETPRRRPAVRRQAASERPDAWQAALKQLAARARSVQEVERALARRGYSVAEIATVIARLRAAHYLDDAEFARTWVTARAHRGAAGPVRLARELRAKGVAEGDIGAALRAIRDEWDVGEAARTAARRKLKSLEGLPKEVARRRLAAHLERRGFSREVILATCRRHFSDLDDVG